LVKHGRRKPGFWRVQEHWFPFPNPKLLGKEILGPQFKEELPQERGPKNLLGP